MERIYSKNLLALGLIFSIFVGVGVLAPIAVHATSPGDGRIINMSGAGVQDPVGNSTSAGGNCHSYTNDGDCVVPGGAYIDIFVCDQPAGNSQCGGGGPTPRFQHNTNSGGQTVSISSYLNDNGIPNVCSVQIDVFRDFGSGPVLQDYIVWNRYSCPQPPPPPPGCNTIGMSVNPNPVNTGNTINFSTSGAGVSWVVDRFSPNNVGNCSFAPNGGSAGNFTCTANSSGIVTWTHGWNCTNDNCSVPGACTQSTNFTINAPGCNPAANLESQVNGGAWGHNNVTATTGDTVCFRSNPAGSTTMTMSNGQGPWGSGPFCGVVGSTPAYTWQFTPGQTKTVNGYYTSGSGASCSSTLNFTWSNPPPSCGSPTYNVPSIINPGDSNSSFFIGNTPAGYVLTNNNFGNGVNFCSGGPASYLCNINSNIGTHTWTNNYQVCSGSNCSSCSRSTNYTVSQPPGFLTTVGGDVFVRFLNEPSLKNSGVNSSNLPISTYSYLQLDSNNSNYGSYLSPVNYLSTRNYKGYGYTDSNNAPGGSWYTTLRDRITSAFPNDILALSGNFSFNGNSSTLGVKPVIIVTGNLTIGSGAVCNTRTLILISGTLTINPNLNLSADNACMFVVAGNITITEGSNNGTDVVNAFLVTDSNFSTSFDNSRNPLQINGAVVTNTNTPGFGRTNNGANTSVPSERISYDGARYIFLLNKYLVDPINLTVQEKQLTDVLKNSP